MPTIQDGPGGGSAMGWQSGGYDLEVESVSVSGRKRYRWTLYDRAHMIANGLARTKWGVAIASGVASWRYGRTL
jgi:hypothetical protein